MPEATTETHEKMKAAAALKASGSTWADVAVALNCSEGLVDHWPSKYPAIWNGYLVTAIKDSLGTVEAEAVTTARRGLRSATEGVAMAAARMLLEHCRKLRGELSIHEHTGPGGAPLQVQAEILAAVREYEVVLMRNEPVAEADGPAAVEVKPGNE